MKNVIKKIASITMAFTLLGTGTAVTKTISSNYGCTLTASSANSVCQYHDGSKKNGKTIDNYYADNGNRRCRCCKQITGTIKCTNHKWKITREGKWDSHYDGPSICWTCDTYHFVKVYSEFRTVTKTCEKCDRKKEQKQHRNVYYYYSSGKFHDSTRPKDCN